MISSLDGSGVRCADPVGSGTSLPRRWPLPFPSPWTTRRTGRDGSGSGICSAPTRCCLFAPLGGPFLGADGGVEKSGS